MSLPHSVHAHASLSLESPCCCILPFSLLSDFNVPFHSTDERKREYSISDADHEVDRRTARLGEVHPPGTSVHFVRVIANGEKKVYVLW